MPTNPEGGEWTRVNVAKRDVATRENAGRASGLSGWDTEPEPEPEPQPSQAEERRRKVQVRASENWRTHHDTFKEVGHVAVGARQFWKVLWPVLEMLQPLLVRHRDVFAVLDKNGDGLVERRELRATFAGIGIDIMGASVSRDLDTVFDALDQNGDGMIDMAEFADMLQVETRIRHNGAERTATVMLHPERKVRSGPAGRPMPIIDRPSAIDAPIEGRGVGDGDAFEVLFEGNFKQMLHAVGRRPTGPGYTESGLPIGERVDVRKHIDAFIRAERELRAARDPAALTTAPGFRTENLHSGDQNVVWTLKPSSMGDAQGVTAAQDSRDQPAGMPMEAVSVQNTLSEGMKFLMHAMHVKKGRLKLTEDERNAIEQLLNW